MGKAVDIVVIGSIIKETIVFRNRQIGPVIGSPLAYSSLVMAAQGKRVGIVTYYGNDMNEIISELDVLDLRGVLPHAHTTTNLLVYKQDGTKYVEYQKKAPNLHFEDIHKDFLKCNFFKVCPMDYEVDLELVKKLRDLGKVIFADLGGYGGATSDVRYSVDQEIGRTTIETLCKNAAIIKASAEDITSIIPGKTPEQAAQYFVDVGAGTVVLTLGPDGAMYKIGNRAPVHCPPFDALSEEPDGLLDFTGAGDSFGAGFMASYIDHRDIEAAVINGNATASLVIQRSGGCTFNRMPSRERIEKRIHTGE